MTQLPAPTGARPQSATRSAELAAVCGLAALALVLALVWSASYEGRRGLAPYSIDGVRYTPAEQPGYRAVGTASWYGDPFHGRPTSSGVVFDKRRFTAAHRTLPLGTRVKVTDLASSRAVIVTINDRGPFVDDRLIDLSRRAAERLGFLERGLARVRVEALVSPLR
jgi:rare lipoprotein A